MSVSGKLQCFKYFCRQRYDLICIDKFHSHFLAASLQKTLHRVGFRSTRACSNGSHPCMFTSKSLELVNVILVCKRRGGYQGWPGVSVLSPEVFLDGRQNWGRRRFATETEVGGKFCEDEAVEAGGGWAYAKEPRQLLKVEEEGNGFILGAFRTTEEPSS